MSVTVPRISGLGVSLRLFCAVELMLSRRTTHWHSIGVLPLCKTQSTSCCQHHYMSLLQQTGRCLCSMTAQIRYMQIHKPTDVQKHKCAQKSTFQSRGLYLDLGHTKGCRRHPLELELTQLLVTAGHPALTSIDYKGHVWLVVMHSREDLLAMARHSERGGDEHMLLVPHHCNAHCWPLLWQLPASKHVLVCGGPCYPSTTMISSISDAAKSSKSCPRMQMWFGWCL